MGKISGALIAVVVTIISITVIVFLSFKSRGLLNVNHIKLFTVQIPTVGLVGVIEYYDQIDKRLVTTGGSGTNTGLLAELEHLRITLRITQYQYDLANQMIPGLGLPG